MKYIQVKFSAEPDSQDVRDIIAALAAEVGFDSFTDSLATAKKTFSMKKHSLRPCRTCQFQT